MTPRDRTIIRDLAKQIAEIAARPEQAEKREVWCAQSSLEPIRPPVYCSPEGSWEELITDRDIVCEDEDARQIEYGLRMRIYAAEHFHDDQVCDNSYTVHYSVGISDWGVHEEYRYSGEARGSYVWDPPIKTEADLEKLRRPTVHHDRERSKRSLEFAQELLGDILDVEQKGGIWLSTDLVDEWARLRGINQMLLDMSDRPAFMHAAMRFMMEAVLAGLEQLESQGLLSLNNGNDYCGSGSRGWTRELPSPGFDGRHVRLIDLWGFSTAQTFSGVSPAMHEEFGVQYQAPILERFGLNYYGCCEPLHLKLDMLKRRLPRLRRVSVSPWADKRMSAEKLGSEIIFGWKPNPAYLAAVELDRELVRRDIRETIEICKQYGCCLEMTIKDTHTCNHQPWRFDEWTRIAMEESIRAAH